MELQHSRVQVGAVPFHPAEFPNSVHVLLDDPPLSSYLVPQPYMQIDPTSLPIVQNTVPWVGGKMDVGHWSTVQRSEETKIML